MTNPVASRSKRNSSEEVALLEALLRAPSGRVGREWEQFVRRYERLITCCVVKALRRYGAAFTRDDLDDLVGEVWLTLLRDDLRKLRQYDAERGFRIASFLGLVATNLTIDHLRARQLEASPLDEVAEDSAVFLQEAPRDELEDRQQAELATTALAQLAPDERSFLIDCFHEERAPEEMARELGVSINTVYSRKFKLRAKLARIVESLQTPCAA